MRSIEDRRHVAHGAIAPAIAERRVAASDQSGFRAKTQRREGCGSARRAVCTRVGGEEYNHSAAALRLGKSRSVPPRLAHALTWRKQARSDLLHLGFYANDLEAMPD